MGNGIKQPLLANKTFSSSLKPQRRINISKVKLDVLKPWICKKIADILQREGNAAIEFVYNKLKQDTMLCPQKLQIRIAGFLNGGKAQKFVCDLWPLLLSAQLSESGIPAELMQQKKEEIGRIEKDIKHEGFSPLHSRSQSSQNKDGRGVVTCGLDGFANICVYSPQQNAANTNSKDQQPSTPIRTFLLENCAEMNEFLQQWKEVPDIETVMVSKKFIYPDEKNIEQEMNATLLPPAASSARKSNFNAALKIEALKSCKRTHSIMVNESKKSKKDSLNKDEQLTTKQKRTKAQKSSSKRSSGKDLSRKLKNKPTEQADPKNSYNEMKKRELELFGCISTDEEEAETNNLNIDKSTLELCSEQPAARNSETVKNNHFREKTTLELDLSISTDEEDV